MKTLASISFFNTKNILQIKIDIFRIPELLETLTVFIKQNFLTANLKI